LYCSSRTHAKAYTQRRRTCDAAIVLEYLSHFEKMGTPASVGDLVWARIKGFPWWPGQARWKPWFRIGGWI